MNQEIHPTIYFDGDDMYYQNYKRVLKVQDDSEIAEMNNFYKNIN